MGLVQNLKKTLTNMVDRILVALSCQYIKHLAKQTTKRRANSSQIKFLQNHLTTESQNSIIATSSADTSEKIIMKDMTTLEIIDSIRDWSLDQIEGVEDVGDKIALFEEFKEWIEPKEDDIDVLSLDQQEQDC
jgi:hypothetical protein